MASNQALASAPRVNKRAEYYPLWAHVQKIAKCGGGGSWEWRCTLCKLPYKGSYPRIRSHFLHETGKGIEGCQKTSDPSDRRKYEIEQDEVDRLKTRHDQLGNSSKILQTSSQGLCLKQGRGEQLNNKYKYQMPKGFLQCKRAE